MEFIDYIMFAIKRVNPQTVPDNNAVLSAIGFIFGWILKICLFPIGVLLWLIIHGSAFVFNYDFRAMTQFWVIAILLCFTPLAPIVIYPLSIILGAIVGAAAVIIHSAHNMLSPALYSLWRRLSRSQVARPEPSPEQPNDNDDTQSTVVEEQVWPGPHEVLGVPRNATKSEIHKAYLHKMKQNHPDKISGAGLDPAFADLANERSKIIQAAYEQLKAS